MADILPRRENVSQGGRSLQTLANLPARRQGHVIRLCPREGSEWVAHGESKSDSPLHGILYKHVQAAVLSVSTVFGN